MIRLGFASRKLNVGHKTIQNFLSKKGFTIKNNSNSKLTDKQYAVLCKEFESSASEKRAASGLTIGTTQVKKKQKTKRRATLEATSLGGEKS
jgi:translation initiation factor IF-2